MAETRSDILQGTLDLMVLQTLDAMGPLHGYGVARRIEQISEDALQLNQGTIYAALLRLQQRRWIAASWGTSDNNRRAKFYAITRGGAATARGADPELGAGLHRDHADAPPGRALADVHQARRPPVAPPRAGAGAPPGRRVRRRGRGTLAMLAEEHVRRGLALDARGAPPPWNLEERCRSGRAPRPPRLPFVDTTLQDLRYGWCAAPEPAYSGGDGDAGDRHRRRHHRLQHRRRVLLRPLPYRDPGRLVRVFETNPLKNWARNIASPANYADWQSQNTVFIDIAAYEQFNFNGSGASEIFLTGQGEPQGLKSLGVTGNLFTVLGTRPLLGRPFTDEETFEGKARVVILSHGLWQSAFAGDSGIIGHSITLSGRAYDVVGVMPRDFFFPDATCTLAAGRLPAVGVRAIAPAALARRRRAARPACRSNAPSRRWTRSLAASRSNIRIRTRRWECASSGSTTASPTPPGRPC
jgi:transcriptional regulator